MNRIYLFITVAVITIFFAFGILIAAHLLNASTDETARVLALAPAFLLLGLAIIIVITTILVALTAFYIVIRWIIGRLSKADVIREFSTVNRLAALAAAFLLFPTALTSLFRLLIQLVYGILLDTPRMVLQVAERGFSCITGSSTYLDGPVTGQPGALTECAPRFVQDTVYSITTIMERLFMHSGLLHLDYQSLILALLTFVLVAMALTRIGSNMTARSRFWLVYSAIAIFAIYLTLSATLAVPLMQVDGERAGNLDAAQLRRALEEISQTAPAAGSSPGTRPHDAGLASDWFNNSALGPEAKRDFTEVQRAFEDTGRMRDQLQLRIGTLQAGSADAFKSLINAAVTQYATETQSRLGTREAGRHYLEIYRWFQTVADQRNSYIHSCGVSLTRIDANRRDIRLIIDSLIASSSDQAVSEFDRRYDQEVFRTRQLERTIGEEMANCSDYRSVSYTPPARAAFGTSLGPVGSATRWLLATESMPVTLITGLVGFGLLGALVARFVRKPETGEDEESIGEIATLVFSGFVAALVVYVAAYGGLAIVSEADGNPNPYIVFAACLTGAVYSSQVWEAARQRLARQTQIATDGAPGNTQKPSAAAKPPAAKAPATKGPVAPAAKAPKEANKGKPPARTPAGAPPPPKEDS